ncbi:MAG: hypothetical protein DLM59_18300 [Pseudonocardiales bacterium]|nr:MAG: hypothetical protein DLM59_18300 [Pseudonocardiales bacterium]
MPTSYLRFSGQSLERLAALSDGIFAVAMTLLVLDLRVPLNDALHPQEALWHGGAVASESVVWHVLVDLSPQLLTYLMSFLTLGIFWMAQQTQLGNLKGTNRDLTWIHLAFMFAVALLPFSTALLAEYITYRLALVTYWLNLLLLGVVLFASLTYAARADLMKPDIAAAALAASRRRILVYQMLYAVAAAACVFNTYLSIALIVMVQLNSAIAPRIRPLNSF